MAGSSPSVLCLRYPCKRIYVGDVIEIQRIESAISSKHLTAVFGDFRHAPLTLVPFRRVDAVATMRNTGTLFPRDPIMAIEYPFSLSYWLLVATLKRPNSYLMLKQQQVKSTFMTQTRGNSCLRLPKDVPWKTFWWKVAPMVGRVFEVRACVCVCVCVCVW